jgi:hypothetical protein
MGKDLLCLIFINRLQLKYWCILFFLFSCNENKIDYLDYTLASSKDNQSELKKVLSYYQNDPVKLEQAEFLVINMLGHFSSGGELVEKYRNFVLSNEIDSGIENLNEKWEI